MLSGVGIIFGAGIYALLGKAAAYGGNALWLSFTIGAVLAAITGLSYAELSSIMPKAGAEYTYVNHAFGKRIAFLIGWMIIVSGILAGATVSLGFAGYFSALFHTPIFLVAILLIIALGLINFYGIKLSADFAVAATIVESLGLIIVIAIGLPHASTANLLEMPRGIFGVFTAAALIFFAYIGFEDIVRLAEETKDAVRTIPLALLSAIAITTVIYILVAIAAVSVLGWEALASSPAPLAEVASKALGAKAFLALSVIALFATANTVLMFFVATSRIIYGMAKESALPKFFGWLHETRRTPYIAIFILSLLAILFASLGNMELVASITDFAIFITFAAINATVICLRYKWPDAKRAFSVPIKIGKFPVLPVIGIVTSLLLIGSFEKNIILYGIISIAIGFLVFELHSRKVI